MAGLGDPHGRSACLNASIGYGARRLQGYVNVLEGFARSNAADAFTEFNQVIANLAGMFAAQRVGEDERLGELTCLHEKASAIDVPRVFHVHKLFTLGGGACESLVVGFEFLVSPMPSVCAKGYATDRGRAGLVFQVRSEVTVRGN